jgi:hypothetical protein
MENSQLIGIVKSGTNLTIYDPIASNVYNQTLKITDLYDTNITTPIGGQIIYFLTPTYRNKTLTFQTGRISNIFWGDMIGGQLSNASMTLTFSSATAGIGSNKFCQYQRLHSSRGVNNASLDATKLLTNGIYSLLNSTLASNAYTVNPTFNNTDSVFTSGTLSSYLITSSNGILLRNECYPRTFEINGFISIPITEVNDGASFILYIYNDTNIIAQTEVCCGSQSKTVVIGIFAVISTTIADVNKPLDLRIKFTGNTLTVGNKAVANFVVKII